MISASLTWPMSMTADCKMTKIVDTLSLTQTMVVEIHIGRNSLTEFHIFQNFVLKGNSIFLLILYSSGIIR